jgi:hypothetical protein
MDWDEVQGRLTEPFSPEEVMFRAGSVSRDKKRAQALAYAEPRVYEDRLNEVLGPDWSCHFITWGDQRLICELTIRLRDTGGEIHDVTRTSTGEFDGSDKIAQGTVAEAQAFKRACSKFGLGRYLYDLPVAWVGYDEATRRLTDTPKLPESALKAREPVPRPVREVRLNGNRASLMHKELGKLRYIHAHEHHAVAAQALSRVVDSFTGMPERDALTVLTYAKRLNAEREASGKHEPRASRQRISA